MKKKIVSLVVVAFVACTASAQKQWTLKECIDYALTNNISLRKNVITKQSAEEDVLQSQAALLPSLSASTSQNVGYQPWPNSGQATVSNGLVQNETKNGYYNGSYGVNANWTVWNGNKNHNTVKLNKLTEQQAELDSAQTANSLIEQIAQLYVQILYSKEAIEVNKSSLETAKKNEERGKTMVKVGSMSKADLAQLTSQVAQAQYNIVEAESNVRNYQRQLKQLLQITDDEELDVVSPESTDAQADAEIPALQSVYESALAYRPEIQNAKLGIQSSEINESIAKAGKLPTVGVSASAGSSTNSLSSYSWGNQMKSNFNLGAGVSVSIPLIDQRQTKTAVNKARLQREQYELELQNQQTTLYSTIEQYWISAVTNQNKWRAAKASTESAQTSYDLLSEQFRVGLKNIVELMTGKDNLLTAQQNELQSKYLTILNLQMLNFYKTGKM